MYVDCTAFLQILQKFVGHSDTISQLVVTPDSRRIVSCGEALFVWELLSHRSSSPPSQPHPLVLPKSSSPRRKAPLPTSYEPLDAHSFTPLVTRKLETAKDGISCSSDGESGSNDGGNSSNGGKAFPSQRIDDESQTKDSTSQDSTRESITTTDEIIIDHTPRGGVELTVKSHSKNPSTETLPVPTIPRSQKHYKYNPPAFSKPSELYVVPASHAGMRLRRVLGYSGQGRNNLVWVATAGELIKARLPCQVHIEN